MKSSSSCPITNLIIYTAALTAMLTAEVAMAAQSNIRAAATKEMISKSSLEASEHSEMIRATASSDSNSNDRDGNDEYNDAPYGLFACRCDRYFVKCVEEELHEDEFVHICLHIEDPDVRINRIRSIQLEQEFGSSEEGLKFKIMTDDVPHNQYIEIKNYGRKMLIATQESATSLFNGSILDGDLSGVKVTGDVMLSSYKTLQPTDEDGRPNENYFEGGKSVQFNLPLKLSIDGAGEKLSYQEGDGGGEWGLPMSVVYWLISVLIILCVFVCTAHVCICRWYQRQQNTQMLKVAPLDLGPVNGDGAAPTREAQHVVPRELPPQV